MARRSIKGRPARLLGAWLAFAWLAASAGPAGAGTEAEPLQPRVRIGPLLQADEARPTLLTTVPEAASEPPGR